MISTNINLYALFKTVISGSIAIILTNENLDFFFEEFRTKFMTKAIANEDPTIIKNAILVAGSGV